MSIYSENRTAINKVIGSLERLSSNKGFFVEYTFISKHSAPMPTSCTVQFNGITHVESKGKLFIGSKFKIIRIEVMGSKDTYFIKDNDNALIMAAADEFLYEIARYSGKAWEDFRDYLISKGIAPMLANSTVEYLYNGIVNKAIPLDVVKDYEFIKNYYNDFKALMNVKDLKILRDKGVLSSYLSNVDEEFFPIMVVYDDPNTKLYLDSRFAVLRKSYNLDKSCKFPKYFPDSSAFITDNMEYVFSRVEPLVKDPRIIIKADWFKLYIDSSGIDWNKSYAT